MYLQHDLIEYSSVRKIEIPFGELAIPKGNDEEELLSIMRMAIDEVFNGVRFANKDWGDVRYRLNRNMRLMDDTLGSFDYDFTPIHFKRVMECCTSVCKIIYNFMSHAPMSRCVVKVKFEYDGKNGWIIMEIRSVAHD